MDRLLLLPWLSPASRPAAYEPGGAMYGSGNFMCDISAFGFDEEKVVASMVCCGGCWDWGEGLVTIACQDSTLLVTGLRT